MKKTLVIILSILLLATPFVCAAVTAENVKGVYRNTFTAALADKYDLLYSTKGPKIVVVGGSSVCFGLDSALLEAETGRKVVDFGLYATLGTKLMLDLSLRAINKGDTVILAPELDSQTLSDYFNQNAVFEALDGRYDMLRDVGKDDWGKMAGGFLTYLSEASALKRSDITPNPAGIYNRASFNSHGDIAKERTANVMTLGYDANRPVSLKPEILSEEFPDIVNSYVDACLAKGADVWFSFCPVNKSGLEEGTTDESIYEFYTCLAEKLSCRIISDINDYILPEEYFYDTNFHLNDVGVKIRTGLLARDLLRAEGNNKAMKIDYPAETPEQPTPGPTEDPLANANTDGVYVYRAFGRGLAVEGVLDSAKTMQTADIPREFNGTPVYAILESAFSGCNALEEITVHDNITFIADRAFDLPALKSLYIDAKIADEMEAGDDLFGGRTNITIFLPDSESYESFVSGYWWSIYGGMMQLRSK